MKKILLVFLISLGVKLAFSQGGAQIMAGMTVANNLNPAVTESGQLHSGFSIAIQSRLKDGTFVAGPGLRYTRISMTSSDNIDFFGQEKNYHFVTVPFNIGLEYRLAYAWKLRMYLGPDVTYFYKIDDNNGTRGSISQGFNVINYDYVNDYFFGAHAGIGFDLYWITFDVSYEKGITDAHKFDNSPYNFLRASIGFFF